MLLSAFFNFLNHLIIFILSLIMISPGAFFFLANIRQYFSRRIYQLIVADLQVSFEGLQIIQRMLLKASIEI